MENIVEVLSHGTKYYFKVNDDLTFSRSTDSLDWEVVDLRSDLGMVASEIGTLTTLGELTYVSLKNENNRLIMETNFGNYVAEDKNVIGDSWRPC